MDDDDDWTSADYIHLDTAVDDELRARRARRTFLSGGARGADAAWEQRIPKFRMTVLSFLRHASASIRLRYLAPSELATMDTLLHRTARVLEKNLPVQPYTLNLLRRSAVIASRCDAMIAIAWPDQRRVSSPLFLGIDGGTGWTCQCFVDCAEKTPWPLFVYFQNTNQWMRPVVAAHAIAWIVVVDLATAIDVECPDGVVAVVGSRSITASSLCAMDKCVSSLLCA